MLHKTQGIILNALPIALMIALIPLVPSDTLLSLIYLFAAAVSLAVRREAHDYLAYAFGLVVMTIAEYFFVRTGVETFTRTSLFGVMPLWLPLLWAYGFVAIARSLRILDR